MSVDVYTKNFFRELLGYIQLRDPPHGTSRSVINYNRLVEKSSSEFNSNTPTLLEFLLFLSSLSHFISSVKELPTFNPFNRKSRSSGESLSFHEEKPREMDLTALYILKLEQMPLYIYPQRIARLRLSEFQDYMHTFSFHKFEDISIFFKKEPIRKSDETRKMNLMINTKVLLIRRYNRMVSFFPFSF